MTNYLRLTGFVRYAQLNEPDNYMGATQWKIDFFPENDAEMKKFKDSGIQKTVKENTDPSRNSPLGKYFQLVRPTFKLIKGAVVNFTPPFIENEKGETITDTIWKSSNKRCSSFTADQKGDVQQRGKAIIIPNGSKVEITVVTYDTFKGVGHRFEGVKIIDLIPWEGGSNEAPPMAGDSVVEEKKEELNDEIPFGEDKPKKSKGDKPW